MRWGLVHLHCPICGTPIVLDGNKPGSTTMHHKEFGICCTKECFDAAGLKCARMILGKDDDATDA